MIGGALVKASETLTDPKESKEEKEDAVSIIQYNSERLVGVAQNIGILLTGGKMSCKSFGLLLLLLIQCFLIL